MTDILLNECGDVDYTDGRLTIVTGVDAIRQRWLIYIRTFLGEWFLDQSIGVPYYQRVLKKAVSRQALKQVFRDGTLEVPGVIQVVSVIVDSLDTATRSAAVSVTCIVTGDEGPETAVFRYTGTVPPGGCAVVAPVPLTVATGSRWYWFDPTDLDTAQDTATGGPYVSGSQFQLNNKFEAQEGSMGMLATPPIPAILPQINGLKSVHATNYLLTGLGAHPDEVAAIRASTGFTPGHFTIFGVYQLVTDPGPTFKGLTALNGVDADGVTRRWINVRVDGFPKVKLEVSMHTLAGVQGLLTSALTPDVPLTTPWAFCLRGDGAQVSAWFNNTQRLAPTTLDLNILEMDGSIVWNAAFDALGSATDVLGEAAVGDLIGYTSALSDEDIDTVLTYLTTKWGI